MIVPGRERADLYIKPLYIAVFLGLPDLFHSEKYFNKRIIYFNNSMVERPGKEKKCIHGIHFVIPLANQ